jgi:hypothetical protein
MSDSRRQQFLIRDSKTGNEYYVGPVPLRFWSQKAAEDYRDGLGLPSYTYKVEPVFEVQQNAG